jgi:hypothetical protein
MTIKDKIDELEYFTRGHYSSQQFHANGLVDYFKLLRSRKVDRKFLKELKTSNDIFNYAKDVVRHNFQEHIYE